MDNLNEYIAEERSDKKLINTDNWIAKNWKWLITVMTIIGSQYTINITQALNTRTDVEKVSNRVTVIESKLANLDVLSTKIDNLTRELKDFKDELKEYRKDRIDDLRRNQKK